MNRDHKIVFRIHAIRRMFERRISEEDVHSVLATGETVAEYPEDTPYPSKLVLGYVADKPIHVVVAENASEREHIVITAYEPDPGVWKPGFRRKR